VALLPEYSRQAIGRQAAELGFIRDAFEKVCRLAGLLEFFEDSPVLSKYLALKGGTAINLTVWNLPRLSVDIDLDFAEHLPLDEMADRRKAITGILRRHMEANGYELSVKSRQYHSLDSFVYSYTNAGGVRDNMKVEINYSLRCHILPLQKRSIETLGVLDPANILTLDPLEIFAAKIVALLTRTAARDLYDVNNMVRFGLFDEEQSKTLRKCVVFYTAVGSDVISDSYDLDRIDTLTFQRIKTDLLPVIRKQERFDHDAARERVKSCLSGLLALTDDERQFLSEFRQKTYRPELLFNGKMLERIKNHPMAVWKTMPHKRQEQGGTETEETEKNRR
jgi:predicted nucleotidyltransferase component of viral defense system